MASPDSSSKRRREVWGFGVSPHAPTAEVTVTRIPLRVLALLAALAMIASLLPAGIASPMAAHAANNNGECVEVFAGTERPDNNGGIHEYTAASFTMDTDGALGKAQTLASASDDATATIKFIDTCELPGDSADNLPQQSAHWPRFNDSDLTIHFKGRGSYLEPDGTFRSPDLKGEGNPIVNTAKNDATLIFEQMVIENTEHGRIGVSLGGEGAVTIRQSRLISADNFALGFSSNGHEVTESRIEGGGIDGSSVNPAVIFRGADDDPDYGPPFGDVTATTLTNSQIVTHSIPLVFQGSDADDDGDFTIEGNSLVSAGFPPPDSFNGTTAFLSAQAAPSTATEATSRTESTHGGLFEAIKDKNLVNPGSEIQQQEAFPSTGVDALFLGTTTITATEVTLTGPDMVEVGEAVDAFDARIANTAGNRENQAVTFTVATADGNISPGDVTFEYRNVSTDFDYEALSLSASGSVLTGRFGPSAGFPVPEGYGAITDLRATFEEPGTYTVTATLDSVNNNSPEPVAGSLTVTAVDPTTDAPTLPDAELEAPAPPVRTPAPEVPVEAVEPEVPEGTTVERERGTAGAVVDGVEVESSVSAPEVAPSDPDVPPSAEEVEQRRTVTRQFVDQVLADVPEDERGVSVVDTDDGAAIVGLLADRDDETLSRPVPPTAVAAVSAGDVRLLAAVTDRRGNPRDRAADGALRGAPGGDAAVRGFGLPADTEGQIQVRSTARVLASVTTDDAGRLANQVELPADLPPGDHTLVITVGGTTTSVGISVEADFDDVSTGSVHVDAIEELAEDGVFQGRADGTFGPAQGLLRGQMATVLARLLNLDIDEDAAVPFDDVADDATHAGAIAAIADEGFTEGCDNDGRFCPDTVVTRGQLAAFLARAYDLPEVDVDPFTDIATVMLADEIRAAAAAGVIDGFGDGTFRPDEPVTRAQAASMLFSAREAAEE